MGRRTIANHSAAIATAAVVILQTALSLPAIASSAPAAAEMQAVAHAAPLAHVAPLARTASSDAQPAALAVAPETIEVTRLARAVVVARATAEASDPIFAEVDGLDLHLPGPNVLALGYHEAGRQHLSMAPRGTALQNLGLGPTPHATGDGEDYVIMASRQRAGAPTTAVDIVMPANDPVHSPVTGRVLSVMRYRLYDQHDDIRIQLVPANRPDLIVTLFHVADVRVKAGQQIEAGVTVLAGTARTFNFVSQVEQWARGPHVDIRVHRA